MKNFNETVYGTDLETGTLIFIHPWAASTQFRQIFVPMIKQREFPNLRHSPHEGLYLKVRLNCRWLPHLDWTQCSLRPVSLCNRLQNLRHLNLESVEASGFAGCTKTKGSSKRTHYDIWWIWIVFLIQLESCHNFTFSKWKLLFYLHVKRNQPLFCAAEMFFYSRPVHEGLWGSLVYHYLSDGFITF